MSNRIQLVLGRDGIGGLCMGFSLAHFIKRAGYDTEVILSIKDTGFKALNYLFGDLFTIRQIPEEYSHHHRILTDENLRRKTNLVYEWYYFCPDLVYNHPRSFDFNKFNVTPQVVNSTRLLTHRLKAESLIYLALNTSTLGYEYPYRRDLIERLAVSLPDYRIYIPVLSAWAGKTLDNEDLNGEFPYNVLIDKDPDIITSLSYLERSKLCVCCDNGPSHLSYQLGQTRILLDPWLPPINNRSVRHAVRWREDLNDSISVNTPADSLVGLAHLLLKCPQTSLLPKDVILTNLSCDWPDVLGFQNLI